MQHAKEAFELYGRVNRTLICWSALGSAAQVVTAHFGMGGNIVAPWCSCKTHTYQLTAT